MFEDMFTNLLKVLTKRKVTRKCLYCKKEFNSYGWKEFLGVRVVNVAKTHCSKQCEQKYHSIIRKALRGEKLTKKENEIIKNVRYAIVE